MRSKHNSKRIRTLRRRRLALALVTAMAAPMALAQSPSGGNVVPGSGVATIDLNGNQTTITQTTKGAIIDWASFNIGVGYGVTFDQQFGNTSVTLNRVIGFGSGYASPSLINGTLTSNGNVFIINPAGITFGGGSQVNVGGLVASTLWLSDANFANGLSSGSYVFSGFNGDPATTHQVRNDGNIIAGAGGVGFVGTTLWNSGSITANGGNIAFGAGTTVTLDYFGDGLTQVTINVPPTIDSAIIQDNGGQMIADGGKILLRTAATAGGTGGAIFAGGLLQANTLATVNGRVELTSAGGPVMLGAPGILSDVSSPFTAGRIIVGGSAGETGGSVLISGNGITLVNNDPNPFGPTAPGSEGSRIDASGTGGGGDITLTSTAGISTLLLSQIDASGVGDANGGTITLSANGGSADLFGGISVVSGKGSGNGGQVNISALGRIAQDRGQINASGTGNGGLISLTTTNGDILLSDVRAFGVNNGGSVVANSGADIYLYGDVNTSGLYGDGGSIALSSQGRFYGNGTLEAAGGINGGNVSVTSTYLSSGYYAVDMRGVIDVSGDTGNGGSARLSGTGVVNFAGEIYAGGGINGGSIGLYSTDATYGGINAEATLYAAGISGDGGTITVSAAGDVYVGEMQAWGGVNGGDISIVGAEVNFNSAIAYGTSGNGGSVSVTADDIYLVGSAYSIDVQGETGGGSIDLEARNSFVLGEGISLSADTGSSGSGGSIRLYAGNSLVVYGDLSARGVDGGGSIYTGSGDNIDLNGIGVDAGSLSGNAGTWTISAPQMTVVNGATQGVVVTGTSPATTSNIQDGDINNAFASGTNVVLQATQSFVDFDAAQIVSNFDGPLSLNVNAEGYILGDDFSITSTASSLDMAFNANASGAGGGIGFGNATLASNGGDILMYGESDPLAGLATGAGNGIYLNNVAISTAGGDLLMRGASTNQRGGPNQAGVHLIESTINTDGGGVDIYGTGVLDAFGVFLYNAGIVSSGGDVALEGRADAGTGIRMENGDVDSGGGDLSILGYGGDYGVYGRDVGLLSGGANILVRGDGGTGSGIDLDGALDSSGGFISLYGISDSGIGLAFGGYYSSIISAGGDISLTGIGETGGVALNSYDASEIDSNGGQLSVIGTASGPDAVGVYIDGIRLVGSTGNVTVDGSSPYGVGVLFANGAGISTTSGAISLIGEGANFGLDLGDGALDTDSGDITLDGTALAATATAGVRMTGGGLSTNGGDITVIGDSGGGVGVQLGDGSAFAIGSGGGAISINGTGGTGGVQLTGSTMDSGNGRIDIEGRALATDGTGVSLNGMAVTGGTGDVTVTGSAALGSGILFAGGAGISTTSGAISLIGQGANYGLDLGPGALETDSGAVRLEGTATNTDAIGVYLNGMTVAGGAGNVTIDGLSALGVGVQFANGAGVTTTSGAISLIGEGANFGLDLGDGAVDTDTGDITLDGTALAGTAVAGVRMTGGSLSTNGGDITVTGDSGGGVGVLLGNGSAFAIGSGGGAISINGTGETGGVQLTGSTMDSGNGRIDIKGRALATDGIGVSLNGMAVTGGTGDVTVTGSAALGSGILFAGGAGISTTSGAISLIGIGDDVGLSLDGGEFTTESGHIDLRGRGLGANSDGLLLGSGIRIVTNGGGIELSGEGGSGAGISLGSGSMVDAGNSLIVLRANSNGSSDAIRLQGALRSGVGVNLRPGGVDGNGGLHDHAEQNILLGGGTTGFALSGAELAMIDSPELIIGSTLHAGSIQVLGAIARDGNLTLQNDGGAGGIDIQAALGVGNGTLALSSGGSITQTAAGAITAHSLLANAAGDVLLGSAQNNVAATTLAGSAGGAFEFKDVDTLAVGSVSAVGLDATSGGLSSLGAIGIDADGNVLVQNLAGDLILNEDIKGNNIDLVTAGRLQNLGGASLIAAGDWRVWANTWEGETRGGLAGSGDLPNLYGCTFLGSCSVTVPATDNHFIYVQQPTAVINFDDFSREYGLPNPVFTFTVTGAILGDTAGNVANGTATTTATIASDVGLYPITGTFTSAAGYRIQYVPGTLSVTPATLFFTADGAVRYLGSPNPAFTGTVTGFRNSDTIESVFGNGNIWSSPADFFSQVGFYPINGGTTAKNYVFSQAPGNATALQIIPLPQLSSTPIDLIRETFNTYVYDRNFGGAPVCAINASINDQRLASGSDELSNEWSKVRSRPNLTNCFETERQEACGSF